MVRKARGAQTRAQAAKLLRSLTRGWERGAQKAVSPEVRAHLRAAAKEGLLAMAILCEEIFRGAEEQTRRARRRVERISIEGRSPRRPASRARRQR